MTTSKKYIDTPDGGFIIAQNIIGARIFSREKPSDRHAIVVLTSSSEGQTRHHFECDDDAAEFMSAVRVALGMEAV